MLEVRDLRKRYSDVVALDSVDLDVAAGEILCLLGPNGAGKTTLVSIVAGLRQPDSGSVLVDGIDVQRRPEAARPLIGLAPQDTGIYEVETVRANLRFFGELHGMKRPALGQRIDEVATALDLVPLLDRRAAHLSGGEKRRLHTALAMLHRPPLLLLDEATVGADVGTRQLLLQLVRERAAEGAAVVYSTHYLNEVEQLDASVTIVDHGRELARGTVAGLVAEHGTTAIELRFGTPTPTLPEAFRAAIDGSVVRVPTEDPARTIASSLTALSEHVHRLEAVEIVRPTLDSVFLTITGRRYADSDVATTNDVPGDRRDAAP